MEFQLADLNDAEAVNDLLNLAYRGEQGWAKENGLVSSQRSVIDDVESTVKDKNSIFLIYREETRLVACICLELKGEDIFIGAFAVHPKHQSTGRGTAMLSAAEQYAIANFTIRKFVMVVLSNRPELIAFYERRGYQRNDIKNDYLVHRNVGIPKWPNLKIEQLIKYV